jgi:adenylate cyclase class IV
MKKTRKELEVAIGDMTNACAGALSLLRLFFSKKIDVKTKKEWTRTNISILSEKIEKYKKYIEIFSGKQKSGIGLEVKKSNKKRR